MERTRPDRIRNVTFLSTRIAGTDGVSLETKKWADVLRGMGLECWFIAGECDEPANRTRVIEEAHFDHPDVRAINAEAFGTETRSAALTRRILQLTQHLHDTLTAAIADVGTDLLIVENALTIPMNVPLGLALIEIIQQTSLDCIAHHHDFVWERERFLVNAIDDFLGAAFPPTLRQIQHVVINNQAAEEFSRRTGLSCRVIPNVMDFAHPPSPPDDYARSFREEIGLRGDALLILQPTRIVPRKAIERSIELVRRLRMPQARLVVSHEAGDEGTDYLAYLQEYADLLEVPVVFAADRIGESRATRGDGRRQFAIADVYPQADLVTYPSAYEGFGNAFLEAVYYRRPVACNRYTIYRTDIEPSGMKTITFDGYLSQQTVDETRRVLTDDTYRRELVEHNYEVGRRLFGYDVVERELHTMLRRLETCSRRLGSCECL